MHGWWMLSGMYIQALEHVAVWATRAALGDSRQAMWGSQVMGFHAWPAQMWAAQAQASAQRNERKAQGWVPHRVQLSPVP